MVVDPAFSAFTGEGKVLGRRKKKAAAGDAGAAGLPNVIVRGPDLDFKIGKIIFTRAIPVTLTANGSEVGFEAFKGTGNTIKQKRKR